MRTQVTNRNTIEEDKRNGNNNVLVVCSYNLIRSPTYAHLLACEGYNTRSAGVEPHAINQIDAYLVDWADAILCLDPYVADRVRRDWGEAKVISMPTTPGRYYMDQSMVSEFERRKEDLEEQIISKSFASQVAEREPAAISSPSYEQQIGRIERKAKRYPGSRKKLGGGRP